MTQLDLQQRLAQVEAERDALQQQVNALAAEALYLKDEIVQHSQATHFCKVCGEDDPCVNDDVCWALTHETPATDAIKRQWMAEGLDWMSKKAGPELPKTQEMCEHFANKLRQTEEKAK